MNEFVLVRIGFLKGESHAQVDHGYVNEVDIKRGRSFFRVLEVLGAAGFNMVNFDAEAIFGREQFYIMLQRPVRSEDRSLAEVVSEAANG
ncbi:MAG: hypothetical protein WC972_03835 [Trueperaceae bacterium]|nr:hypothetical protein [Truepera sp.]HRN17769.1 hypothetical protein [Trueperaceae bacterium]